MQGQIFNKGFFFWLAEVEQVSNSITASNKRMKNKFQTQADPH